jgi:hypothetical protein
MVVRKTDGLKYVCVMKYTKRTNSGGFSVGIIDGGDLCSTPLRSHQLAQYIFHVSW